MAKYLHPFCKFVFRGQSCPTSCTSDRIQCHKFHKGRCKHSPCVRCKYGHHDDHPHTQQDGYQAGWQSWEWNNASWNSSRGSSSWYAAGGPHHAHARPRAPRSHSPAGSSASNTSTLSMPPDAILNKVIAERVAAQCKRWREELPHHEYQKKVKHNHQRFHPDHAPPLLQDIFTSLCKEFGKAKDTRRQETEP